MIGYAILLIILQIISDSVNQPVENPFDSDTGNMNLTMESLNSQPPFCNNTEYFDEKRERCLKIVGGGTLLYVNKTKSCGVNVLKPHCGNPRHYYVCKKNQAILAECGGDQYFSFALHKCVHVDRQEEVAERIGSGQRTFDSIKLPVCKKSGSFPVLNDCTLFYTCEIKDHRMSQTVFKCPRTMIYDARTEMCSISATCDDTYLNVSSICEPNAEGRIALLHREHELIDQTTSNYESEITSATDSNIEQMPLESYEWNDSNVSTEDIFNMSSSSSTIEPTPSTPLTSKYPASSLLTETIDPTPSTPLTSEYPTSSLLTETTDPTPSTPLTSEYLASSLLTETTDPSLQTSTWQKDMFNEEFEGAGTTTEDSLTTKEPLHTTTTVESSTDRNDEVTSNTPDMYSTSTSDSTYPSPAVESTSTEMNEPSVDSSTQQGTPGLNEEERDERPTTELSWTEITSTVSAIESSTFSGSDNESTTSNSDMFADNSNYQNELLSSTEDVSTTTVESFTNSALLGESVTDIVGAFNDAAFSISTDAANYVSTESAEDTTHELGELNDISNDMDQIIQNFTSTLNAVSALESALVANANDSLDLSNSSVNKESCEDMLQSLLARLEKNEALLKNESFAERQDVTASHQLNPTISSHIALPLATRLLNITSRFEHRLRNILKKIPKPRT